MLRSKRPAKRGASGDELDCIKSSGCSLGTGRGRMSRASVKDFNRENALESRTVKSRNIIHSARAKYRWESKFNRRNIWIGDEDEPFYGPDDVWRLLLQPELRTSLPPLVLDDAKSLIKNGSLFSPTFPPQVAVAKLFGHLERILQVDIGSPLVVDYLDLILGIIRSNPSIFTPLLSNVYLMHSLMALARASMETLPQINGIFSSLLRSLETDSQHPFLDDTVFFNWLYWQLDTMRTEVQNCPQYDGHIIIETSSRTYRCLFSFNSLLRALFQQEKVAAAASIGYLDFLAMMLKVDDSPIARCAGWTLVAILEVNQVLLKIVGDLISQPEGAPFLRSIQSNIDKCMFNSFNARRSLNSSRLPLLSSMIQLLATIVYENPDCIKLCDDMGLFILLPTILSLRDDEATHAVLSFIQYTERHHETLWLSLLWNFELIEALMEVVRLGDREVVYQAVLAMYYIAEKANNDHLNYLLKIEFLDLIIRYLRLTIEDAVYGIVLIKKIIPAVGGKKNPLFAEWFRDGHPIRDVITQWSALPDQEVSDNAAAFLKCFASC